jgi:hypothetical protein
VLIVSDDRRVLFEECAHLEPLATNRGTTTTSPGISLE